MIRDRLDRDLEPLVELLRSTGHPAPDLDDAGRRRWLTARDTEATWVFDQAPVHVVPTSRVIGHVEIGRFPEAAADDTDGAAEVADHLGLRAHDLWLVGALVGGGRHGPQVARFLLRESVRYVAARDGVAVVDRATCWPGVDDLGPRLGLAPAPVAGGRYAVRAPGALRPAR